MTTKDYLPLVVVGGYVLGGLMSWAVLRLTDGSVAQRLMRWASRLVLAATTILWLWAGAGLSGMLVILGLFAALPFTAVVLTRVLGQRRRQKAGAVLEPIWPRFLALAFALPLFAVWLYWTLNPLLRLTGLARTVDFHVTGSFPGTPGEHTSTSYFSGTYILDGQVHPVDRSWWLSFSPMPQQGDTIRIGIGPLWPHTVFETVQPAIWFLLAATLIMLPLTLFTVHLALGGRTTKPAAAPKVRGLFD